MPRANAPVTTGSRQPRRHHPLEDDLVATGPLRTKSNKRKAHKDLDDGEKFVDSKSSRKILKIGQELANEDSEQIRAAASNTAFNFESRLDNEASSEEEAFQDDEEAWGDEDAEEIVEEVVSTWSSSIIDLGTDLHAATGDRPGRPGSFQ